MGVFGVRKPRVMGGVRCGRTESTSYFLTLRHSSDLVSAFGSPNPRILSAGDSASPTQPRPRPLLQHLPIVALTPAVGLWVSQPPKPKSGICHWGTGVAPGQTEAGDQGRPWA